MKKIMQQKLDGLKKSLDETLNSVYKNVKKFTDQTTTAVNNHEVMLITLCPKVDNLEKKLIEIVENYKALTMNLHLRVEKLEADYVERNGNDNDEGNSTAEKGGGAAEIERTENERKDGETQEDDGGNGE
jgi:hypothetical protein